MSEQPEQPEQEVDEADTGDESTGEAEGSAYDATVSTEEN